MGCGFGFGFVAVWLTEAPKNGSYSTVIAQLVEKGVRAVYISDLSEDQSGVPSQWTSFAADVGKSNTVQVPSVILGTPTNPLTKISRLRPPLHHRGHLSVHLSL